MAVCTFLGHRECPESIKPVLHDTIRNLILFHDVDIFYVGNQGQFDAFTRSVLHDLSKDYPHVRYAVVLAYMPKDAEDQADTMFPEGIEMIHPRYAITWRNNWMLREADFVVTYITHTWGGAYQFAKKATSKGKHVFNLS